MTEGSIQSAAKVCLVAKALQEAIRFEESAARGPHQRCGTLRDVRAELRLSARRLDWVFVLSIASFGVQEFRSVGDPSCRQEPWDQESR